MSELASPGQLRMSLARWCIVLVPLFIVLGSASGLLSGSGGNNPWYQALEKPALNPPGWVFGVVWPILYALQAIALAMIIHARGAPGRMRAIILFVVQLVLNLAWSPLFFGQHEVGMALWLLIAILVVAAVTCWHFGRIRRLAAWLMVPYLAWLCFAAYLNFSIDRLNPDAESLKNPVARTQIGSVTR